MNEQPNPYHPSASETQLNATEEARASESLILEQPKLVQPLPGVSPIGTTLPRHMAATVDSVLAIILSVFIAKLLPEEWTVAQIVTIPIVYLAYFFVLESLFSATVGKFMSGLVVRSFDGSPCTVSQTGIRTLFRLIEVNPMFLGSAPAMIRIICTRDKQRFGDQVAGTIVVRRIDC